MSPAPCVLPSKMFLAYFNAPETLCYNYADVYDGDLLSILLPIMHYVAIVTIIFSVLLIYVIITKTPKKMKLFKTYLLPYVINTLMLELVMLLFKPFLMHPFFAIYSLEFNNVISTKFLLIFFILMSYFAMALIDCIVGMSAEQYFATTNFQNEHSKIPFIIFSVLSGSSVAYLITSIIAIQFQEVRDMFVMSEDKVSQFLNDHLKGSIEYIDAKSIIVFRSDIPVKEFAVGFTLFISFVFSRYVIAIVFLILKATKTQVLNVNMSKRLKKNNQMLLRCTYAQFLGFCSLAGFPAFIIVATFYFLSEPSCIISFCFLLMNCFGLYDIIVTVICIKPYRAFFLSCVDYIKLRFFSSCFDVTPKGISYNSSLLSANAQTS